MIYSVTTKLNMQDKMDEIETFLCWNMQSHLTMRMSWRGSLKLSVWAREGECALNSESRP